MTHQIIKTTLTHISHHGYGLTRQPIVQTLIGPTPTTYTITPPHQPDQPPIATIIFTDDHIQLQTTIKLHACLYYNDTDYTIQLTKILAIVAQTCSTNPATK